MKKVILSAAIAFVIALGISNTVSANTTGNEEVSTVLTDVKNISEIEVHGNVLVYLTSGDTDKVKVYNDYYAGNALVQEENNTLRITSFGAKQLVVWVTVNQLAKLSVFNNAEVKSFGKFSALDLTVSLYNQAVAQLDMDAFNASIMVNDRASADLTGYVENGSLRYDRFSRLNAGNLTAASLTETINKRPMRHFRHFDYTLI